MQAINFLKILNFTVLLAAYLYLSGCQSSHFSEVFNGHSAKGFHSRGIDVNGQVLCTSGAKGKVSLFDLKSHTLIDTFSLPANDFRAVQYCNDHTLLLMNSGDTGLIYKYNINSRLADTVLFVEGAFFDALKIDSLGRGVIMGDPIGSDFMVYLTKDFGETWQKVNSNLLPKALMNEAGFAASNTGISIVNDIIYFATGASDVSRLIRSSDFGKTWTAIPIPIKSGGSYGIYSTSFKTDLLGLVAGGSYKDKTFNDSIVYLTIDGGQSWGNISKGLPGYMSCIQMDKHSNLIVATGRMGAYYTQNNGKKWFQLTSQPFYSALIYGHQIILSGQDGTLSIFEF